MRRMDVQSDAAHWSRLARDGFVLLHNDESFTPLVAATSSGQAAAPAFWDVIAALNAQHQFPTATALSIWADEHDSVRLAATLRQMEAGLLLHTDTGHVHLTPVPAAASTSDDRTLSCGSPLAHLML